MTRQKPGDAVNNSGAPPLTAPAELRYAARQSSVSEALMFVTFRVGRANDADVVLEDTRVSRRQIEITVTAQRRYFVIDCGSTGGTQLHRDGGWAPFIQGYVGADEQIAFGGFALPFSAIVARLPASAGGGATPGFEPLSVRPLRKIDTGEVVLMS